MTTNAARLAGLVTSSTPVGQIVVTQLGVATISAITGVSSIRNTSGVESLSISATDPLVRVGATGANLIQARNTAKWWVACNGFVSIQQSYGVASLTDSGSTTVTINFSTPTTGGSYAAAISHSHAGGITWNGNMNNSGQPAAGATNYRFSYGDGGTGYTPFAWSAVGFGDQ
jgi:hypothetical protein